MLSLANKEFKVKLCDNEGWVAHLVKLSHFTFVSRRPPHRGREYSTQEQYLPTTVFQVQLDNALLPIELFITSVFCRGVSIFSLDLNMILKWRE